MVSVSGSSSYFVSIGSGDHQLQVATSGDNDEENEEVVDDSEEDEEGVDDSEGDMEGVVTGGDTLVMGAPG